MKTQPGQSNVSKISVCGDEWFLNYSSAPETSQNMPAYRRELHHMFQTVVNKIFISLLTDFFTRWNSFVHTGCYKPIFVELSGLVSFVHKRYMARFSVNDMFHKTVLGLCLPKCFLLWEYGLSFWHAYTLVLPTNDTVLWSMQPTQFKVTVSCQF